MLTWDTHDSIKKNSGLREIKYSKIIEKVLRNFKSDSKMVKLDS